MPSALHLLRGNPGHKNLTELRTRAVVEATPDLGEFNEPPPPSLNECGLKHWNRLADLLKAMKLLAPVDFLALENLCLALQTADECHRHIERSGLLLRTKAGIVVNPLARIERDERVRVMVMLAEFGLSPLSRLRLTGAIGGGDGGDGTRKNKYAMVRELPVAP